MGIYSRKIVGWEVHENESAEQIERESLVLHSDNGSLMKGATMLATLQKLGIIPSLSRPSVSDDNPYSKAYIRNWSPIEGVWFNPSNQNTHSTAVDLEST